MTTEPFTCPACGEFRLVDADAGWYFCQVCGKSGPRALRLVPPPPPDPPAPFAPESLERLVAVVVARHLPPGAWHVAACAPLRQWPRGLQQALTQTLGAAPESVVLVLERETR